MNNYAVNIQNNGQMIPVAGALLMDPANGTVPAPNYGINFQVNGQKAPVFAMIVIDPATGLPASLAGGGGAPGGADTNIQFNDGGALGGSSAFTFDKVKKAIALAGAVLTSATPLLDLSVGWNNAAVAFTGLKLNVTDTASASGSLLLDLQVGGSSKFNVDKSGVVKINGGGTMTWTSADSLVFSSTSGYQRLLAYTVRDTNNSAGIGNSGVAGGAQVQLAVSSELGWTNSASIAAGTYDLRLARDAANTLAQRNGTNAQAFNIYGTYTDASNYEKGFLGWEGSALKLSARAGGTGSVRTLMLDGAYISFALGGSAVWAINAVGNFISLADNAYDIGTSGNYRPRNAYIAANVYATNYSAGNAGAFFWGTRSQLQSLADGQMTLYNNANTSGVLLDFATDANLKFRNRANNADANIYAGSITTNAGYIYFSSSSDAQLQRIGVGIIKVASNTTSAGAIVTDPKTVANLPSASTAGAGARAFVTDSNQTTTAGIGTTVAGGGANNVPVYSDGTNWKIG